MKKTIFKIMSLALTIGLLASLIVSAVPAGAAGGVNITSVLGTSATISAYPVSYTITMTGGMNIYGYDAITHPVADTVTVIFPTNFDLSQVTSTGDITFDAGDSGGALHPDAIDYSASAAGIITFTLADGQEAIIGVPWYIVISDVRNPDEAGYYNLSIYTSKDTVAAESPMVVISSPGIIMYYNASGAYLGTEPDFASMPDIGEGWTVKVGPGFYFAGYIHLDNDDITLTSTGAGVMIMGFLDVDGDNCEISNLTFYNMNAAEMFMPTDDYNYFGGDNVLVSGCSFNKTPRSMMYLPPPASINETLVYMDSYGGTMTNCTFDMTSPSGFQDFGIVVNSDDVTIEDCTFKVDQTAAYDPDTAIGDYGDNCLIENNTFTGSSGWGIYTNESTGNINIQNNTFTGLEVAVYIYHNEYETYINGNTITDSTVNGIDYLGAIHIKEVCCGQVFVYNNTISDNAGYSVFVDDLEEDIDVYVSGNNFYNNAKGFGNESGYNPSAVANYWGNASGPMNETTNPDGEGDEVSDDVVYEPFLTVANTAAFAYYADDGDTYLANSPAASKDAGFAIKNYDFDGMAKVVGQTLSGNPQDMEPSFPAIAYFDIYTSEPNDYGTMQVNLYADGLTAASNVYYWSGTVEGWKLCSDQGVAGSGAFVWFKVAYAGETTVFGDETSPSPDEMVGTSFVIVDGIAPPAEGFELSPVGTNGVTGLSNIPFSWPAVPGATGYKIVIWTTDPNNPVVEEDITSPSFMVGSLPAGSYFWQVFAMQGETVIGESTIGTFVAAAPAPTSTPITITTQPPATITFTQPPATTLTITQPAPEPGITPAWIWGIIGIGAVLVIVVIVLIVRTRRTS